MAKLDEAEKKEQFGGKDEKINIQEKKNK